MGNSQSNRSGLKTEMSTVGKSVMGGVGSIPVVGPMMVPWFEKASSSLGIFRTKPNRDNDSMQEIMRARQEAEDQATRMTQQEREARQATTDAAIADAESRAERVIKVVHEAFKAREEAEARARECEASERKAASDRGRDELKAAVDEAHKQLEDKTQELEKARADALELSKNLHSVQGARQIISKAEEQKAKERIQYNTEKLHFAVCGPSGSGKSSLINAFRGLEMNDKGAAGIGEVETTNQINRYPDLRTDQHYSRFVWYDVPGAGTMDVKGEDYFCKQGLFVFDFVVIVYGERFTKIALDIISECIWFKIPMFVVRSKSDSHIENKLKMRFGKMRENEPFVYNERYQAMRSEYIKDTEHDFDLQLMKLMESDSVHDTNVRLVLPTLRLYNVSALNIKEIAQMAGSKTESDLDDSGFIDEYQLIEDMLKAAMRRRYPKNTVQAFFEKGFDTVTGALSSVKQSALGHGSESGPSSSA